MYHDSLRVQIMEAVGAHEAWKLRLYQAAQGRDKSIPVERIKSDTMNHFGKWLHGLPVEMRSSREVQEIINLHRAFHSIAYQIADQIALGDFDAALRDLEEPGFAKTSRDLTTALTAFGSAS